ncbi:MAG: Hydrogen peroxide-inducible genes activator [Planctomycetes bacterium]|nr:Hydrogen peroxide-inducible genes activator [Planctomycetota bacterium]
MDLTLRQLEYAAALARHRHFGRAAAACGASQSALSEAVADLETALGVRLFERDRKGVRVTAAGEGVVARAEDVLSRTEDLRRAVRELREPFASPFRMGVIPTIAPFVLPRGVPALRARWPRIELVLREGTTADVTAGVADGSLDAAVVAAESDTGDLDVTELYRDPFLIAVPARHPLARRAAVTESSLRRERLLLLEDGH